MRLLKNHSHASDPQGHEAGKVGKPKTKEDQALMGRKISPMNENHRHATSKGWGEAKKMQGKAKSEYGNENKINTKYAKNHLNRAHNSENASWVVNDRPMT
ncbi:MAG: hypothetical protein ABJZ69_17775 [Hyphomicrobiales bacterium]